MEETANVLGGLALGSGVVALGLVSAFWGWMRRWYREWIPKVWVSLFRLMAAVAGVLRVAAGSTAAQGASPSWLPLLIVAALGYALWELVGIIGDAKAKAEKKRTRQDYDDELEALRQAAADAEGEAERLGYLASSLRELVTKKIQRVREALRASTLKQGSLPEVKEALSPVAHARSVLENFAVHLRNVARMSGGRMNQNFRIAVYGEKDGFLHPIDAFDLRTRRHDPLSSYSRHKDRFCLDNRERPAHAVQCLHAGRMLIVENCGEAPDFDHFSEPQKVYLKSMVACPQSNVSSEGGSVVVTIDTDAAGYFREEHCVSLELQIEEFAVRLALEYALAGLVREPLTQEQE